MSAVDRAYPDAIQVKETGSHRVLQIEGRRFSVTKEPRLLDNIAVEIKDGQFVYTKKAEQVSMRIARFKEDDK
jgi:hypothetical protein